MDDLKARAIVADAASPADLLVLILVDRGLDPDIREAALNHAAMSTDTVLTLMDQVDEGLRARILSTSKDASLLEHFLADPDPSVRALIAFNPATPPSSLEVLAGDADPTVRANAMYNPGLAPALVRAASDTDVSEDVRSAAADALGSDLGTYLRDGQRDVWYEPESEDLN
jgi:HEAT repeat protein